ncbi:MAG: sigma-70 family RNA polymerase sigma factor [Gemmatimonadota bacterium]|nr:sigma-70 family RNA polymerase sigma factor [Gemmatimonadota bacterium]
MFRAGTCRTDPLPDRQTLPNLDAHLAAIADGVELTAARRLGDRDDARDAAHETVARLLALVRAGRVAHERELAPVAWGIAKHVIADVQRHRARHADALPDVPARAPGPLDALVSAEDAQSVRDALVAIPEADRALLARCFVDGERIGDIAQALGEPAERLRKRKSRALQRLADALACGRNTEAPAAGRASTRDDPSNDHAGRVGRGGFGRRDHDDGPAQAAVPAGAPVASAGHAPAPRTMEKA